LLTILALYILNKRNIQVAKKKLLKIKLLKVIFRTISYFKKQ